MELILDKMLPPAEPPRLSRGRLLKLLDESLNCYGATVIYGRAGPARPCWRQISPVAAVAAWPSIRLTRRTLSRAFSFSI
jgi:hypothetical protein